MRGNLARTGSRECSDVSTINTKSLAIVKFSLWRDPYEKEYSPALHYKWPIATPRGVLYINKLTITLLPNQLNSYFASNDSAYHVSFANERGIYYDKYWTGEYDGWSSYFVSWDGKCKKMPRDIGRVVEYNDTLYSIIGNASVRRDKNTIIRYYTSGITDGGYKRIINNIYKGNLYIFKELWHRPPNTFMCSANLYSGKINFRIALDIPQFRIFSIVDNKIYVVNSLGELQIISTITGQTIQTKKMFDDTLFGSLSIDSKYLFVASLKGSFYCLDRNSLQVIWKKQINPIANDDVPASSASRKVVYVSCKDNTVKAFWKKTGSPCWSFETNGLVNSEISVDDNVLTFTTDKNLLYVLRSK